MRAGICAHLAFIGIVVDAAANGRLTGAGDVAAPASSARVHVVPAREDAVVARAVRSLLPDG